MLEEHNIGDTIINIGFWGLCYTYNKEPPKVLVIIEAPILASGWNSRRHIPCVNRREVFLGVLVAQRVLGTFMGFLSGIYGGSL